MTTDIENSTSESTTTSEVSAINLEEYNKLKANYHDAVAERDKTKAKLRKLEEASSNSVELQKNFELLLSEKSTLQQQYENLQIEVNLAKEAERNRFIETSLITALEAAGTRSIPTAIKLIDKSKLIFEGDSLLSDSVIAQIEELRTSDPILFGDTNPQSQSGNSKVPGENLLDLDVKHAQNLDVSGAFEKELKLCKNNIEIQNVLKKYGKI